jgi:dTDP-4-dehydrorhamnose reductase
VKALVVRTSWLFGKHGKNFANRVLAAGREGGEVKAVSDWFGSPTSTVDLSRAIRALVEKGATGVVHVVNAGSQSRLEQAKEILGALGKHKAALVPVESATLLHLDAPRPRDTTLASERLDALGITMRPRAEAVRELAS